MAQSFKTFYGRNI